MNGRDGDLHADLLIDKVIARRAAGGNAQPGSDEALVAELSKLSAMDWPADEAGDWIAANVAAAIHRDHATAPARSPRARWIAAATAAAAAAALVIAGVLLTTGSHGTGLAGHVGTGKDTSTGKPRPKSSHPEPATLTAMTVISHPGQLKAIGVVGNGDDFLTCVTTQVCYIEGFVHHKKFADIARSDDGGATWKAGAQLPSFKFEWNAGISCPKPLTCFSAFGSSLIETTDGFAHIHIQPVTSPADQVEWVSCPTTEHCVAVVEGDAQSFMYSDNGGVSWTAASSPSVPFQQGHIAAIRCDANGACIAPISGGVENRATAATLYSRDGGRTWAESATRPMGYMEQWVVSCGDARNCVIGSNDGTLAWLHVTPSGHASVRVELFPKGAPQTGIAISCATGRDCFLETSKLVVATYLKATIETTRDAGRTWTFEPMVAHAPLDIAPDLSCPVPAGCVAVANDQSDSAQDLAVLSSLQPNS